MPTIFLPIDADGIKRQYDQESNTITYRMTADGKTTHNKFTNQKNQLTPYKEHEGSVDVVFTNSKCVFFGCVDSMDIKDTEIILKCVNIEKFTYTKGQDIKSTPSFAIEEHRGMIRNYAVFIDSDNKSEKLKNDLKDNKNVKYHLVLDSIPTALQTSLSSFDRIIKLKKNKELHIFDSIYIYSEDKMIESELIGISLEQVRDMCTVKKRIEIIKDIIESLDSRGYSTLNNVVDYYDICLNMRTAEKITSKKMNVEENDRVDPDPTMTVSNINVHRYWWLFANPSDWDALNFRLYDEMGYSNSHKVQQNFKSAQQGDLVIVYKSTSKKGTTKTAKIGEKSIVGIFFVSKPDNGKEVFFKKILEVKDPFFTLDDIKSTPVAPKIKKFQDDRGTFYELEKSEYLELILGMFKKSVLDILDYADAISKIPLGVSRDTTNQCSSYSKNEFIKEVYCIPNDEEYDKLVGLLKSKKNVILQGAPGVGKTFAAKRLAYSMMNEMNPDRTEFIQFHQNYSYEDFIMGYKPNDSGFELKEGVFYKFCKKAEKDPEREYFFIIDEINRGNLSKIFGELLMLIENDYRGNKGSVTLAYKEEKFSVPENLYIIGMMNTADRSLAMIDYALRRRFSFFDMKPAFDSTEFTKYKADLNSNEYNKIIDAIIVLNKEIEKDSSLGPGFCIGHSYFCNQTTIELPWLKNVINYDILPMLREYWFDNETKYNEEKSKLLKLL